MHTLCSDGMSCAVCCDAMLCFFMYMNIHTYKMADDDDDDALMLSATYCELMHINLYWSLSGAGKNARSVFYKRRAT